MVEIISHRGNLEHPDQEENSPTQIEKALKIFRVEIDVWHKDKKWFLGHDAPTYEIGFGFFDKKMILHCKNLEAVKNLHGTRYNWFWHENDKLTLTSHGEIWCYPGVYIKNGITVSMEIPNLSWTKDMPKDIKGICTDYPLKIKELKNGF